MRRKGGTKRKTRQVLKKLLDRRGKIRLTDYLRTYKPGDKVVLSPEPSYQKGMPFRRFFGKVGVVKSKVGNCYTVAVSDNGKMKTMPIHPVHLKRS